MAHQQDHDVDDSAFSHLQIRPRRDSQSRELSTEKYSSVTPRTRRYSERFPANLHFQPNTFRLRSPTQSSIDSTVSSALFADSSTIHSVSTIGTPLSSSYATELQDLFKTPKLDDSLRSRANSHRHQPSSGSSFTFVNDEDDSGAIVSDLSGLTIKIEELENESQSRRVGVESLSLRPTIEPSIKEEDPMTPCASQEASSPDATSPETTRQSYSPTWENTSAVSSDIHPEDADGILDYTLQLVYGMDLCDVHMPDGPSRRLVDNFVRDIGRLIWQTPSDTQLTNTMSNSSYSSTPSQGNSGGDSQRGEKRKIPKRNDDEGEEYSDGEGSGSGYLPIKRPKPNPPAEENLRLSCPFRKRNPHRFNVRDHHSCAMTYFPKFAELRQHIVKQHKRDDPSAFVCDRCNRDFVTRKELREHQRLPREQMCDISDHDPESGIDGPTANKLLSRKRASGSTPEVQWKEIWNILFPDDDDRSVHSYYYTPVIEHFELSRHYLTSFKFLEASLRDKISNQATLETLAMKFHECFAETVERCIASAQNMPYTNRSNKRNEPARVQSMRSLVSRTSREIVPRPDSGVVMDDGSEESGSVIGAGLKHKDSIRTVRGRSSQSAADIPKAIAPAAPVPLSATSSGVFDQGMLQQYATSPPLGINPGAMDHTMSQSWAPDTMMPSYLSAEGAFSEQFLESGILTPQTEFQNWPDSLYQTNFTCMGQGFSGFGEQ